VHHSPRCRCKPPQYLYGGAQCRSLFPGPDASSSQSWTSMSARDPQFQRQNECRSLRYRATAAPRFGPALLVSTSTPYQRNSSPIHDAYSRHGRSSIHTAMQASKLGRRLCMEAMTVLDFINRTTTAQTRLGCDFIFISIGEAQIVVH
jgi:hypothetical protein